MRDASRQRIAATALAALLAAIGVAVLLFAWAARKPARLPPPAPVGSLQAIESGTAVTDADGGAWVPDRYSQGGSIASSEVPIAHTATPALYRSERLGIRSVAVPLRANGSYLVVLYFAETSDASPGERTFDVRADGRYIATIDVARDVGALEPYHLPFTVHVTNRRLSIEFVAHRGEPILSALRVTPVASTLEIPPGRLLFDDEFNGPQGSPPASARWSYDLGGGWGQRAYYTDRSSNVSLDGAGHLVIAARNDAGAAHAITSARITTDNRFAFGYGVAQARVEVAGQPGFASAFWGLGTGNARWPRSGEIDPLEVRGSNPRALIQALHMPDGAGTHRVVWERAPGFSLAAGFHTAAVEHAPGVVVYSLDGRQTASLTTADVPRGSWVFDKSFVLILNLIAGGWAGPPRSSTQWPVTMSVDWVRVFS